MAHAPRSWDAADRAIKNVVSPNMDALRGPFMAPDARMELFGQLLTASALRGPIFRRHLLNGRIDQDETLAQGFQLAT